MIHSMIIPISSSDWTAIGIPLANHLWQSTLFAAVAGLVTLLLRRNRAQVRYWLWLAASLKFLIPFSLLIAMGSHLAPSRALPQPGFSVVIQDIGQPFASTDPIPVLPSTRIAPRLVPTLVFLSWLSGCVGVLFFWCLRWRRVTKAVRGASPLVSGRELEARHRLEQCAGVTQKIRIIASTSTLEPGVIGIFRPVLVVPAGITDRLSDAQLEAILLHELCHVRRRDNLVAMIHMLVEAVFWFHPLVWWIGARLVDERERACDEEVVRLGSDPQVYAEGILKVCEFYLESPLVCVAGVTGSNLKKRIEDIMSHRISHSLNLAKKVLLTTIGVAAVVVPLLIGFLNLAPARAQAQSEVGSPAFTNVSIRPHQEDTTNPQARRTTMLIREPGSPDFKGINLTLKTLIGSAYDLKPRQISGGPDWVDTEGYDITAKTQESARFDQVRIQLQNLLADRFKLKFHRETKEEPVYDLVVGTNGLKLKEVPPSDVKPEMGRFHMTKGHADSPQIPMRVLAGFLSNSTGRMVFDKTGLQGNYDITLNWTAGDNQSLITAVQEQLGLELKPQTAPIEHLIIDSAEKPSIDQAQTPSTPQSLLNDQATPALANPSAIVPVYESLSITPDRPGNLKCPPHPTQTATVTEECPLGGVWFIPGGFVARVTTQRLISLAYHFNGENISGTPDWANSEMYDVSAKFGQSTADELQKVSEDQRDLEHIRMLRALLAERFKLRVRGETRELPVYALLAGESGPRLLESIHDNSAHDRVIQVEKGQITGRELPVATLASMLSEQLGRPVLDKTGLTNHYDIVLRWSPTDGDAALFSAVQQQLGLKLEPQRMPVDFLVVDHVERPEQD
jgi:uncharacterized protein (TIGR03435 family)